jgi:hypothetical protein
VKLPYGGRENDELSKFIMNINYYSPSNHNQLGRIRGIEN